MVYVALVLLACAAVFSIDSGRAAAPDKSRIVERGLVKPDDGVKTTAITVRLRRNASESELRTLVGDQGGITVKENSRSRLHVISLPDKAAAKKAIEALKKSPLVEDVAETRVATVLETANDTNYAFQWHMHDTAGGLRVEPAWDLAPSKGSGVVVAVIDTGVAYEAFTRPATPGLPAMAFQKAPDLAGLAFVAPKNYVFDDAHANDDHSHGSHVTGTIAQATNNAFGVAGVAENVTIMPIKVLDYTGAGADADLVDAL
jgi:serine protease